MDDDACGARLPPAAAAEPDLDFWGPLVVDEAGPRAPGLPDPAAGGTRVVHRLSEVRAAVGDRIEGIVIPFNGVLVTRELVERIGLCGPSTSSGATTTSTDCVRRPPAPGSPPSRPHRSGIRGRQPGPDDVRPHDVQPQPQRPEALLHGAQQPAQPARVQGAARAGVRPAKTLWFT